MRISQQQQQPVLGRAVAVAVAAAPHIAGAVTGLPSSSPASAAALASALPASRCPATQLVLLVEAVLQCLSCYVADEQTGSTTCL